MARELLTGHFCFCHFLLGILFTQVVVSSVTLLNSKTIRNDYCVF